MGKRLEVKRLEKVTGGKEPGEGDWRERDWRR